MSEIDQVLHHAARSYMKHTFRLWIFRFFALSLLVYGLCFSAHAANDVFGENHQNSAVCRTDVVSIHIAKETALLDTGFPDHPEWFEVARLPDKWDRRWPDYQGNAWYRIKWNYQCPEEQWQPLSLMIGSISMAGQIFINRQLLWQSKSLTAPLSMSWNMPRHWVLMPNGLKQGENETLIRVIPDHLISPGVGEFAVGAVRDVKPLYETTWLEKRGLHVYAMIFELVLSILAALIWILRPKEQAFGWYAVCTFMWVLYVSQTLLTEPLRGLDGVVLARVYGLIFFFFCWTTYLYAFRFANRRFRTFEKCGWGVFIGMAVLLAVIPDVYLKTALDFSFLAGFSIYMINCVVFPWIAYKSGRYDAMLLAGVMLLIYFPLGLHDGWHMFIRDGVLLSPYASPFSTLIIAVIFALRLTDGMRRIEHFNQTLSTTVLKVRADLRESMEKSHHLELKNAKLNERIQLAHDLHDGLGGSLVRSMSLVEQKGEHLNKTQVLSMLKHLRDDLRQVIDSGSSQNISLPESPVMWLAPIRHRFNLLFDELDVKAVWSLAEKWGSEMSVSDCLAYQRVLEEALTNVVKHSHATEVRICLNFEEKSMFRLSVEDNGVGFDADAVEQAGLSVGMRSMQSRMQKIQAQLNVSSVAGKTVLYILKDYSRSL